MVYVEHDSENADAFTTRK